MSRPWRCLSCRDAAHARLYNICFDHETSASLELSFPEPRGAIDARSQQLMCEQSIQLRETRVHARYCRLFLTYPTIN